MNVQVRLFVQRQSRSSQEAQAYLEALADKSPETFDLFDIVDVDDNPDEVRELGIIATPTLLILNPPPSRRIIGSMNGIEVLLGIQQKRAVALGG